MNMIHKMLKFIIQMNLKLRKYNQLNKNLQKNLLNSNLNLFLKGKYCKNKKKRSKKIFKKMKN